jgi:molecular chaperone DnaJ
MNIKESYRELGLAPGSSDTEIKEAWRRLAARWHPDRNASAHALRKIQRINRALAEIRRWKAGAAVEADDGEEPACETVVEHTVTVTLEEAFTGCTRELTGELVEDCRECAGTGLQAEPTRCGECGGTGRIRPHLWFVWLSPTLACGGCEGRGTTRARCACCEGSGKAPPNQYRCRVQVPPGTRAGCVLEVTARVQARQRSRQVALHVRVELQPHEFFTLEAEGTVKCEVPVDGFAWMAERWIEVPTPCGRQQMRLRRGYLTYRIKGQGLGTDQSGPAADCIVTVVPLFPEALSQAQDALLNRLIASNSGAAGTAAGARMAAWNRTMDHWQARSA